MTDLSIVAVDTGGTFTDVVRVVDGRLQVLKVPSTPDDPARAVLQGVQEMLHGSTDTVPETGATASHPDRAGVTGPRPGGGGTTGTRPARVAETEARQGRAPETEARPDRVAANDARRDRGGVAGGPPDGLGVTGARPDRGGPPDASPDPGAVTEAHPAPRIGGDAERFVLIHGSTVATNALLERRGARVVLVTNRGFEDVIEIGRQDRPQLYALVGTRPPPLVARADRHGIAGRLGPDGGEEEPLDDAALTDLAARLEGAEAVAVCLLHSYANPEHERRVAAALESLGIPLSISCELLPEFREYERTATTVVNAYVAPGTNDYLGRIEAEIGAAHIRIMGSGGGALPVARARQEAVHTVLSGPAGGVVGALRVAEQAGVRNIITFDMGGTSTDVSLCPGRPLHTREFTIAGLPVAVPVIDIHTVGAGGGSLARIDAGRALHVGPESAGADPGPIAYGRGGSGVTVTDAHVWLGRLPVEAFLGGARRLERSRIEGPLRALAESLDRGIDAGAEGVLAVADTAMEGALRVISVERGYDPADFTLIPFGGAAALHACELAGRLGISCLLVPPAPGVLSAYGMLASPVRKDTARTVLLIADDAAPERVEAEFGSLEAQAVAAMRAEGVSVDELELRRWVDARYRGQSYELRVPAEAWPEAFHTAHKTRYGYERRDALVEAVTLRVEATVPVPLSPLPHLSAAPTPDPPTAPTGEVVFGGERFRVPRHARDQLLAGHRIRGPAIIAEYSATTWLPPGWRADVHATGSLVVVRE